MKIIDILFFLESAGLNPKSANFHDVTCMYQNAHALKFKTLNYSYLQLKVSHPLLINLNLLSPEPFFFLIINQDKRIFLKKIQ